MADLRLSAFKWKNCVHTLVSVPSQHCLLDVGKSLLEFTEFECIIIFVHVWIFPFHITCSLRIVAVIFIEMYLQDYQTHFTNWYVTGVDNRMMAAIFYLAASVSEPWCCACCYVLLGHWNTTIVDVERKVCIFMSWYVIYDWICGWSVWASLKHHFKNTILKRTVFLEFALLDACVSALTKQSSQFNQHFIWQHNLEEEDGGGGVTEIDCATERNRLRLSAYTHTQNKPTPAYTIKNAANLNSLPHSFSLICTVPSTLPSAISIFLTLL